jgi:hypothetical protein
MNYWLDRYDQRDGNRIGIIENFTSLRFVRSENSIGALEVVLPIKYYNPNDWWKNQIIEVWKSTPQGNALQGETAYFLRDWDLDWSNEGELLVSLYAYDANWLLSTRIVAYAAGSPQADKADEADDMMKAIIRENFVSLADTERQLASLSVAPDYSQLPSISKAFSRRNVFNVLRDISDTVKESGIYNAFDIIRTQPCNFEFRTYKDCRGIDHSRASGQPRFVGEKYGNLVKPKWKYQSSDEATFVYAGGQGEEEDRIVKTAYDDLRIGNGYPYNFIEKWIDARHLEAEAAVQSEAEAELAVSRPRQFLSGNLIDMPSMRYGLDFGFGDIVTTEAFGQTMDLHITTVDISVDSNNGEKIGILLKGEEYVE